MRVDRLRLKENIAAPAYPRAGQRIVVAGASKTKTIGRRPEQAKDFSLKAGKSTVVALSAPGALLVAEGRVVT
jgi:hypothetical protein